MVDIRSWNVEWLCNSEGTCIALFSNLSVRFGQHELSLSMVS